MVDENKALLFNLTKIDSKKFYFYDQEGQKFL